MAGTRRRQAAVPEDPPLPPVQFSLTPYTAVQGILDFSTSDGRKFYERATAPLSAELFDCQPDKLRSFLENLSRRVQTFRWSDDVTGITMIPHDFNNPEQPPHTSIITNYGQIDIDHIRNYETTFISIPTQPAQNTTMLYPCLINSLSAEALDMITIWKNDYMINKMPSGNLLLKIIIRESHIDTNATESSIRMK